MKLQHLPREATAEEIGAIVKRDGAVIVDDVLSRAEMEAIETELRPWLDQTPVGGSQFSGTRTRRTGALIARSPKCRELVMNPLALTAAGKLLSHASTFQLHVTQAIAIGPGEPAQVIHRDQWAFDFFPFPRDFEVQCNAMWALTDFTEENGATRVIPGSNHSEDRKLFREEDSVPAEMRKGSVMFYSGSVYHGGGANRSNAERIGLYITYCLGWLRQEENQYLSCPREIAETLPEDLLRLMGYQTGAYALGYINDQKHPMTALHPEAATEGASETLKAARRRLQNELSRAS